MNVGEATVDAQEPAKTVDSAERAQTRDVVQEVNGTGDESARGPPRRVQDSQTWVKVWRRVEIGLLVALIVVVWGLLLLPVVIYHLPDDKDSSISGCVRYSASSNSTQVCQDSIHAFPRVCLPNSTSFNTTDVFISPRGRTQEELEEILEIGLRVVRPSPQCEEVIVPFLCLYYLRPCDGGGEVTYRPSVEDCVAVSTEICPREWAEADVLLNSAGESLPSCEALSTDASGDCSIVSPGNDSELVGDINSSRKCLRECRDGFYCSSVLCRARCDKWQQKSKSDVIVTDTFNILAGLIGLLSGILVLVLSCIQWKRMFKFPSIIVVYMTVDILVLDIFVLLMHTDRNDLFCSTVDLIDSLDNPTVFCVISGVVLYHILLQLLLWWLFHMMMLFWNIRFPIHARNFETSNHLGMKLIHIACVSLALLVPWIPVIVVFASGGFNNTSFPPFLCFAKDADTTFYSLIIPLIILLQVGVTMLIAIFWTLHKRHSLFTLKPSKMLAPLKLDTPEKKILLVSCYYVLIGVVALTAFTQVVKDNDAATREHEKYFVCESGGIDPDSPEECDRSGFERYQTEGLLECANLLLGISPFINLAFVINIEELKQFLRRFIKESSSVKSASTQDHLQSPQTKTQESCP